MLAKILLLGLVCTIATSTPTWEKEEDSHHAPQPYRFGYEVKDKEGSQYRHEEADGHGTVKGSYGYTDDKGIYREVQYVADKNGFRAKVKTNEPGTANQDPADVKVEADPQIQQLHGVNVVPEIVPVYREAKASPIRPVKQYHKFNSNNYNVHSFSPLHSFRYNSAPALKFRPSVNIDSSYKHNIGKQVSGYKFHVPHYRNLQGFNGHNQAEGFKFDDDEIERMIEELKTKGRYSGGNLEGFGSDDEIEKMLEELKNKGRYSGNFQGLGGNDFRFEEFRNLNLNKHKSLFSKDSLSDDFDLRY